MAKIIGTSKAFPENFHTQDEVVELIKETWKDNPHFNEELVEKFYGSTKVNGRYLAMPLEKYSELKDFDDRNSTYIDVATEVGKDALEKLFASTGVKASEIDQILFTTVTGIAVPSIDARLVNLLDFRTDVKRVPLFGLGCLAGAAGVARAQDYLAGHPADAVVLLSIELCSLTFQTDDLSVPNLIGTALFGDGAAAVLMVGDEHPLAKKQNRISAISNRSVFFHDSLNMMGWDVKSTGFKLILNGGVPEYAETKLCPAIMDFLKEHDLTIDDIEYFVCHPGGPKVIRAIEKGLDIGEGRLYQSREVLNNYGNCSSSSVLFILDDTMKNNPPRPGSYGLMLAMGPGFCGEVVLLKADV